MKSRKLTNYPIWDVWFPRMEVPTNRLYGYHTRSIGEQNLQYLKATLWVYCCTGAKPVKEQKKSLTSYKLLLIDVFATYWEYGGQRLYAIKNYGKQHSRYQLAVRLRWQNGNGLGTFWERIRITSLESDLTGIHRENEGRVDQELPGIEQSQQNYKSKCIVETGKTNGKNRVRWRKFAMALCST
jgi:hypothetical protein